MTTVAYRSIFVMLHSFVSIRNEYLSSSFGELPQIYPQHSKFTVLLLIIHGFCVLARQNESWHFTDRDLKRGISVILLAIHSLEFYRVVGSYMSGWFQIFFPLLHMNLCISESPLFRVIIQKKHYFVSISRQATTAISNKKPEHNHSTLSKTKEHHLTLGFYLLCHCLVLSNVSAQE